MLKIRSKLPDVGVTIFSVMTALANEHKAINLSQGFPDFDVEPKLIERVNAHMHSGANQYAAIPVSAFYNSRLDHHVVRFCFAKKDDTLKKAAEKLCRI